MFFLNLLLIKWVPYFLYDKKEGNGLASRYFILKNEALNFQNQVVGNPFHLNCANLPEAINQTRDEHKDIVKASP